MESNYFIGYSIENDNLEPRDNCLDVWNDILTYSLNLKGNWLLSKQVFYGAIVPTAEKDPALFAKWVNEMVKKSGVKVKSRAGFVNAIDFLRKSKGRNKRNFIKKALFNLLESGLDEPLYAMKALKNINNFNKFQAS